MNPKSRRRPNFWAMDRQPLPPFSDSSDREDRVHSLYEQAVDRLLPDYPFRYDGRAKAKPATRTRKVAQIAHRSYRELVRPYDRDGYDPRVHRITKRQLNRAANTLADLIVSLT